jgi:hypothetical protein
VLPVWQTGVFIPEKSNIWRDCVDGFYDWVQEHIEEVGGTAGSWLYAAVRVSLGVHCRGCCEPKVVPAHSLAGTAWPR